MSTQQLVLTPSHVPRKPVKPQTQKYKFFRSSSWTLWLCLLISLIVRIWLVIHTHGVIEGDEALVGIQAQHILQGERPVYFYAQPYMGSLEAYLVALLFAVAGSSVWTLRAEPILLSLLLVWLTWCVADALAKRLPPYARQWFRSVGAFCAALPPLYDIVLETRTYGGYIETLIIMLLLLLAVVHLTQRWHRASWWKFTLCWMAIGLVVGIGFWVYPLTIIAVLAVSLWLAGFCIIEILKPFVQRAWRPQRGLLSIAKGLAFLPVAVPAALIGAFPAIYWGATNNWANITYLLDNSSGTSQHRLQIIGQVTHLYVTCTVPRVIGGAVPTEPYVTIANPHILTPSLVLNGLCIAGAIGLLALSLFWHHPLLIQVRQLIGLPLLFALCAALIFCISSISANGLGAMCGPKDLVGRYGAPLLLTIPFFIATLFTLVIQRLSRLKERQYGYDVYEDSATWLTRLSQIRLMRQGLLVLALVFYIGTQYFAYIQASPNYLFQTSGCVIAPFNDEPIISYMQHQNIHYAWATNWVGDPITFKTQSRIIVIDPRVVAYYQWYINRIPAYTSAVANAKRASVLLLVAHDERNPPLIKRLKSEHTTYSIARFPSEPGYDLLVITPHNHSITPKEISDTGVRFGGC